MKIKNLKKKFFVFFVVVFCCFFFGGSGQGGVGLGGQGRCEQRSEVFLTILIKDLGGGSGLSGGSGWM